MNSASLGQITLVVEGVAVCKSMCTVGHAKVRERALFENSHEDPTEYKVLTYYEVGSNISFLKKTKHGKLKEESCWKWIMWLVDG